MQVDRTQHSINRNHKYEYIITFLVCFRFPDILSTENLKATWIHPFFRDTPLFTTNRENTRKRNEMIQDLTEEVKKNSIFLREMDERRQKNTKNNSETTIRQCKGLFKFLQDSSDEEDDETLDYDLFAHKLVSNYTNSANQSMLEFLHDHKVIANLFMKYNTTLQSSASTERLFSIAKTVLKMHRCRLSDRNFEYHILNTIHWNSTY